MLLLVPPSSTCDDNLRSRAAIMTPFTRLIDLLQKYCQVWVIGEFVATALGLPPNILF